MTTRTIPPLALAHTFHAFVADWQGATRFSAAPSAASLHPAYRAMVDLGPEIIPLILAELAVSPRPSWFAALRELTGNDPVPSQHRGYPAPSAGHWLAWGRARGLV